MGNTQVEAQPQVQPQVVAPRVSPEEEKVREELQTIFLDLLTSAQKVAYELATIDMTKETFTRDELKDFFNASKEVVSNVKRMHKFLEKFGRRR